MFQAIVDERAYEFAGELIRKADLIRWGMLKSKMDETKNKMKAIVSLTDYDSKHPYSQLSGHAYYKMSAYTWTRNGIETTEKDAKLNLYGLNYGEMDINRKAIPNFQTVRAKHPLGSKIMPWKMLLTISMFATRTNINTGLSLTST